LANKFTYGEVEVYFKEQECILLASEYTDNKTKLKYQCNCGNVSEIRFGDFRRGKRCNNCAKTKRANSKRQSYDEIFNLFKKEGCLLLTKSYKNTRTKLLYKCSCGSISETTSDRFKRGSRCMECRDEKLSESQRFSQEFISNAFIENGCELLSNYKNSKTKVRYRCICGDISEITYYSFRRGHRCKNCATDKRRGELNPRFNHGLSNEERVSTRKFPEYEEWRRSVFERDKYTCKCCNKKGGDINAHHKDGYNWCIEKRLDTSNGVTLCESCHYDFHFIHGYGNNTREQFDDWLRNKERNQDAM
jgi:hypothetical protein